MSEEFLAVNLLSRRFSKTAALFGVVLAAVPAGSASAQLLIANPNGNQTITGGNLLFSGTSRIGLGVTAPAARLETVDTATQLLFGTATDQGFLDGSNAGVRMGFGARFDGTNWRARKTNPTMIAMENGALKFYSDSGLTVGDSYTPTERARLVGSRLLLGTTVDNGTDILQLNGTATAQQPAGLGTNAAAGKVFVLNESGQIPNELLAAVDTAVVGVHDKFIEVGPTVAGQAIYPLPGSQQFPHVQLGGVTQTEGVEGDPASGSYYIKNGNINFFTAPTVSGLSVKVSVVKYFTGNDAGGGAMSSPADLWVGDGTTVEFGPLPYSKENPWIFVGSALQINGVNYTVDPVTGMVTFTEAPPDLIPISVSCSIYPLLNTDAETLNGYDVSEMALRDDTSFAELRAVGPLLEMVGQGDADGMLNSGRVQHISRIVILCPEAKGTGDIEIDLLMQSVQGETDPVSLFTTKAKPKVVCNGGRAWAIVTGANLPDTIEIPNPAYLSLRVLNAPVGVQHLRVWLY